MHPAFLPYRRWIDALGGIDRVPPLATLNRVAQNARLTLPDGRALSFEPAPSRRTPALAYERRIADEGVIEFREGSRHDLANALVWFAFPRVKAALNAVHLRDGVEPTANGRSRARDAATLADEAGMIFACRDVKLIELLRAWRWRALFWERRNLVAQCVTAVVIGHGLLDKLREPFRALTAQAVIVDSDVRDLDCAAALQVREAGFAPHRLAPLPVAALPGWDWEGIGERLFDDSTVFRAKHSVHC